ncbi:hypothetical protein [Pseudomonas sp. MWU13-2105]|uniref:hypothetical protein n=1 Tax=Pseudomonas sp. MWU13-2105 TaxID=2935074 RepID=UPI0020109743|nr:hypothetical protein [Pseudomonas sp. MWU13-2105]
MTTRIQETSRFEAIDKHGRHYTIIESTQQTAAGAGVTAGETGSVFFRALNFGPVSQISDSEFQIFLSGVKVKRV